MQNLWSRKYKQFFFSQTVDFSFVPATKQLRVLSPMQRNDNDEECWYFGVNGEEENGGTARVAIFVYHFYSST